jgi:hypothetical protein
MIKNKLPADYLDEFTQGYLECVAWVGLVGPDGEQVGYVAVAELSDADREECESDCEDFVEDQASTLCAVLANQSPSHAGHNFFLTRNRHGAGFWDNGLGEAGDMLTKASHAYGEVSYSSTWVTSYQVVRLDVWGHIHADCAEHGCDCGEDGENCQCSEDVNDKHALSGTLPVYGEDPSNEAILAALLEGDYLNGEESDFQVDEIDDGSTLSVDDVDGRMLLELVKVPRT